MLGGAVRAAVPQLQAAVVLAHNPQSAIFYEVDQSGEPSLPSVPDEFELRERSASRLSWLSRRSRTQPQGEIYYELDQSSQPPVPSASDDEFEVRERSGAFSGSDGMTAIGRSVRRRLRRKSNPSSRALASDAFPDPASTSVGNVSGELEDGVSTEGYAAAASCTQAYPVESGATREEDLPRITELSFSSPAFRERSASHGTRTESATSGFRERSLSCPTKTTTPGEAFSQLSESFSASAANSTSCSKTPLLADKAAKTVRKSPASDVFRDRSASCGSVTTRASAAEHAQQQTESTATPYRPLRKRRVRIQEPDVDGFQPFEVQVGPLTDGEPGKLESGSPELDNASAKRRDSLDFPNCRLKKGLSEGDHEKALAWYAACEVEPLDGRHSPDTAYWILDPNNEDPGYGV